MSRKQGPECPRCECPDTEVIGERVVFGQRRDRCRCDFCHVEFTAGGLLEQPEGGAAPDESMGVDAPSTPVERTGVAYNAAPPRCICPKCNARNPLVKKTDPEKDGRVTRYHRCDACGFRFKSLEETGSRQR